VQDWESGLVQPAPLLGGITPAGQPPRLRLFAAEDDGGPRLLQGLLHRVQVSTDSGRWKTLERQLPNSLQQDFAVC
jgi:hypothetical protein